LKDDPSWARVQGKNTVTYHGLPPGSYTFEVQSSYDNYNWSNAAIYIFDIATPWWQSWWFYVICAAAVAYGLWSFYRYRISQLKKIQLMRTRISQDLHDEVGATLSSIHVYSSVASKLISHDTVKAQDALKQINSNTIQVMENMNDIVWAMNNGNPGEISLESKLKNYGYELLTPLNIVCNYSIDKEAERKLHNIEARKNILLIAKEAINNIAKHSRATLASVQLEANAKELHLIIHDNGIGIDLTNTKAGNGLRNMKQRAGSMGGHLQFDNPGEGGNRIFCRIPIANIRG
jgi:signal transduction histidine kinase